MNRTPNFRLVAVILLLSLNHFSTLPLVSSSPSRLLTFCSDDRLVSGIRSQLDLIALLSHHRLPARAVNQSQPLVSRSPDLTLFFPLSAPSMSSPWANA
jgi:hypothetical protein